MAYSDASVVGVISTVGSSGTDSLAHYLELEQSSSRFCG